MSLKSIRLVFLIGVFATSFFYAQADKYPKNYSIDVIHYNFSIKLSDSTDAIQGEAAITIKFKKSNVKNIRLDLINKSISRKDKGMLVRSIYSNGELLQYIHSNDALTIINNTTPDEGSQKTYIITYEGIPAEGMLIGPTKYGDRSFFTDNWPNKARNWIPTIDHPYDKATSEFKVYAPSTYQVVSNGLLKEESFPEEGIKLTHWSQNVATASWLYVIGVTKFAVQYVGQFNHKSIQSWVYPKDRDAGFNDFAEPTKQVLKFFSSYIGPYAYEKIANVQVAGTGGGMEAASSIFYNENLITGNGTKRTRNVIIHELAHQWFGNAVTESTWDDVWLSEGFATFFTLLFIENAYGHKEFVEGLIDAKKILDKNFANESDTYIISDRSAENGPVSSYAITYQKGAWVLHMLRELIGDANFKKGIQAYYNQFMNGNASTNDFRVVMEKASGKNLKVFFNQWLYSNEKLMLEARWKYEKKSKQIIIDLTQIQASGFLFDMPLEIGIVKKGDKKPKISDFSLNTKNKKIYIPSNHEPLEIIIDPNLKLLATTNISQIK